ncbi:hypothetical protein [Sporotomaculum syntrophicum]|uniref:hypothetical protein n=1 Tax=Sporotomaculum syntrophicum TaxID=182264 RepID=UPI00192A5CF2|nr:hypothetical protein [Sporotomaculum syntrophicum]
MGGNGRGRSLFSKKIAQPAARQESEALMKKCGLEMPLGLQGCPVCGAIKPHNVNPRQ